MGTRDTYQRTLLKACLVAGDEVALAKRLGVPVDAVVNWLLGDRQVPLDVFLFAVDLVLSSSKAQVESNKEFLEKIRARRRHVPRST